MYSDIEINGGISLFINGGDDIPEVVSTVLNSWIKNHEHDFYGWSHQVDYDHIQIIFENPKRGSIVGYIKGLSRFLKYAKQFELDTQGVLGYVEHCDCSLGDYAMGSVYISSEKEASIIRGMTNYGDCIDETIEWKNV